MFIMEQGRLGMIKFGLKSSDTVALTLPLMDYLALGK
jgi:hypothetical protein